ncbi:hypothetical protein DFH08DRAFT_977213 [Mycena albidolilacea]|uniref:Uncharacterized protein n=1 Tax=Mycena albidolilacea TaxID=1033008 RepID=A0AAD6Z1C5_9AGAR|nr:hypothetical protein DFH08DRAFT_977213 [Mycena albidolilacea]
MSRVNPQAVYLACSFSGSRPLSYTAENEDGGANWAYLSPPRACRARPFRLFRRVAAAPSRVPWGPLRLHIRAAFCVDENPRLTACTCIAYQRSEPIFRTSYVPFDSHRSSLMILLRNTRERTYAAFSHTAAFSIYDIVLATRLSLDTHRRSFCYTSSLAIQEGPSTHPDDLPQRRPAAHLLRRSSFLHIVNADHAGAITASRTIRVTPRKSLHERYSVRNAARRPHARHRPGAHHRPSPHHQPPTQHTFHAAHAAFIASPPHTCRAPRHHLHDLLRLWRALLLFPISSASFIASLRGKRDSSRQDSPRLRPRFRAFQHDTDHLRHTQHMGQSLPIAPIALITSPRAATVS